MKKLVYGVGINDVGAPVYRSKVIDGKRKREWACPYYTAWANMLMRCYCKKFQSRRPTYYGCEVVREWHKFSSFKLWMEKQDWEGKALDKDILTPGNKVYCPRSCAFVSRNLNNFLTDSCSARGDLPIGVSWSKKDKVFEARCCSPFTGKQEYLGCFRDPDSAYEAWRSRKRDLAFQYASAQSDERLANAIRERYA